MSKQSDMSPKAEAESDQMPCASVKEYTKELRDWMNSCACWQATVLHYSYAIHQSSVLQQQQNAIQTWSSSSANVNVRLTNGISPQLSAQGAGNPHAANDANAARAAAAGAEPVAVTRYRIPAIWRRVCAELIDFFLLMVIRMCVLGFFIKVFDFDEALTRLVSSLPLSELAAHLIRPQRALHAHGPAYANVQPTWNDRYGDNLQDVDEMDDEARRSLQELEELLLLSPLYLLLELANTFIVTAYETLFTMREWRQGAGACTPGKWLFGLRLVRATDMLEMPDAPDRGLLGPPGLLVEVRGEPSRIGFVSALCRATMKNFSQTFLFPLSLTALFARNHRAAYDIVANVIVVELL